MSIKHTLRRLLWKVGYDISRFAPTAHSLARREKILDFFEIDIVLDVGANSGQFAQQLRYSGYKNKILCGTMPCNLFFVMRLIDNCCNFAYLLITQQFVTISCATVLKLCSNQSKRLESRMLNFFERDPEKRLERSKHQKSKHQKFQPDLDSYPCSWVGDR